MIKLFCSNLFSALIVKVWKCFETNNCINDDELVVKKEKVISDIWVFDAIKIVDVQYSIFLLWNMDSRVFPFILNIILTSFDEMITISILPFLKYLSFLKNKIREISSEIYIFCNFCCKKHIFYTFYIKNSPLNHNNLLHNIDWIFN